MANSQNNTNKKVIIGIICAVVALLIVAGILAGVLLDFSVDDGKLKITKKSKSKSTDDKPTTSQTDTIDDENQKPNTQIKVEKRDTGKKTVEVKDVEAKITDNEIVVPIYATKNPGMTAAELHIDFDTNAFSYADCRGGDIFKNCTGNFVEKEKQIRIIAHNGNDDFTDVSGAGIITNVVLIPKEGVKAGKYSVKITDKSVYANVSEQYVHPTVKAGDIILK